ncbi:signal transduction histidine kinase [Nocardioides sp. BE266]|uniref:sensor histidine kinase n=1 Tax=Nocardioides sp. BE266 TaxID=2817725 RepID=UPI00285615BB|nr:ATP-binding protein [Nocardioides sp. BE266]MDR7254858.1 signal transduction histidine kinase [Nocardioides sp. BE266]
MAVRRGIDVAVATLVVAAVLLYAVSDDVVLDRVLYVGMIAVAGAAAWVGALRAPAEQRLVGMLIAAGITLTAVGDSLWELLDATGRATDVSIADPPWFASYVVLCVALSVVLHRSGAGRHDVDFTIDAITIVAVSFLVLWSAGIDTIAADETLPVHVRVVWAAYPVADAVLLALVVRVLTSRTARRCLDPSFAVGAGLWLAADIAYLQPYGSTTEVVMNVAWMVAPVLIARSVWRLRAIPAESPAPAGHGHPVFQLVIAIGPLLVPPALELLADLRGQPHRPLALMVGATVLTVLAFARMARLVRSEERAVHELEAARDAALEASRAKSMFLATMSHEIRTPLTMVLGAGEILEDTELDDLQLELVRRMRRSGQALRSLVDDVLDFSRIEAGEVEVARVPFELPELVARLAEVCRPRAEAAGIAYESFLDPDLPQRIVGDPDRLAQVIGNLLDNAVKFTHSGHVRLDVRPAPSGDGRIELAVSDTGIGIPEAHLASVFESFKQVDGSSTRRYGGAGLGLAICTQLATAMGGTLDVTSTEGVGTVFVARVPLPSADPVAPDGPPDDAPLTSYDDGARRTATTSG